MRGLVLCLPFLGLAACQTPDPIPPVLVDPCISSASAPVEAKPAQSTITPAQQGQVDMAVLNVLGEQAFIEYEWARLATEAWGERGWQRVERTREWCLSRQAK